MSSWGGKRNGAGRKTLYSDKKAVKIYLTEEAIQVLEEAQKTTGMSRSDIANMIITKTKGEV